MEPRSRRISATDGLELHLLEWSEEGVPFVLLHGFGNDAHIWDDFAPRVAPHYRTIAIDLRGHGDSDHDPEARYDYAYHVADLEQVFETLGIERLVLVGHSLGGRIATLFAGAHPERMAGLVIVDSGPEMDARGTTRIRMDMEKTFGDGADGPVPITSVAEYARLLSIAYPEARPEAVERMAKHGLRALEDGTFERKTDSRFHTGRIGMNEDEAREREEAMTRELWEALERIPCPTLVVRGAASDILSPDTADKMAEEALAQGQLAVVGRASHSVMTDNPEEFASVVSAFVLGE